MKPKTNTTDIPARDQCQTPPYALNPLWPYLRKEWRIWEPAAGEGLMVDALRKRGHDVEASDVLTGRDFFKYAPESFDAIVTNPPYSTSIKFRWMRRCYMLGKPFALLVPLETIGAKSAQRLMDKHGFELILMDKRVDYKMPDVGWKGKGAQFPSIWFTWGLKIGQQVTLAKLDKPSKQRFQEWLFGVEQLALFEAVNA